MKLTKKLEGEVMKVYNTYWESYLGGDMKKMASCLDKDITVIGSTEGEIFFNKKEAMKFYSATADQIAGVTQVKNRKITTEVIGELILFIENVDLYVLVEGDWTFYAKGRISSLLRNGKKGWKFIHQHGSLPDTRTQEGEQISLEKISKENLELRDAVKRRTVELENKNRELEIETALERVRSVAMGMKLPVDMLDICRVISQQLELLNVNNIRNVQTAIFYETREIYVNYEFYPLHDKTVITEVEYNLQPDVKAFVNTLITDPQAFFTTDFKGAKLRDWIEYQKKAGQFVDPNLYKVKSLHYYFYSIGPGALGISTYAPLGEHDLAILKRFRNVFHLAYQRYSDIALAEAQAREARIEVSLEKVRSRTMAMQNSSELGDVATVLFRELNQLVDNLWTCGFVLCEKNRGEDEWWLSTGDGFIPAFYLPNTGDATHANIYEAWEKGESYHTEQLEGDALQQHYDWLMGIPVSKKIFDEMLAAGKSLPAWQKLHCAYFSYGYLVMITQVPCPEEQVFKRFAQVFDQTYIRFLDLQKAEEQAREAKIEAALERVRSRAMAMQNSEELNELIGAVFTELTKLDLVLTRSVIMIYEGNEKGCRWWMANSEDPSRPANFFVKYADMPFFNSYLEGWNNRQLKWVYILEDEDKIKTDDFLFKETELSHLPDFVIAGMRAPYRVYLNTSFNNFGQLTLASLYPLSEEHFDILLRFAKVFDLTYTRFNDLKQAEAQARESQIEASLERVRSKAMSMQKSEDLADAVATVFEELDKLDLGMLRCGIGILNKTKRCARVWSTTVSDNDTVVQVSGDESMDIHPLLSGAFNAWLNQVDFSYILKGEDLKNYYKALIRENFLLPDSQSLVSGEEEMQQYYYNATFSAGGLFAFNDSEFSAEAKSVLRRFADVFNLTYTRFNDLKVAEAHARQAEEDLVKLQAEKKRAEEALTELRAAQKQLIQSEKMASLGELTAGIAHEIQNPLNFVNNFSEINKELIEELKGERLKAEGERDVHLEEDLMNDILQNIEKINHHGKRADAIVKGMLQHSRTSSGKKEPTDINALADEYLRLSYHGLRAKDKSFNAEFKTDFDETIGKINVIPQDIGRLLLNLYNNAFYAVAEKKKSHPDNYEPVVLVSTIKENGKINIIVKDNGMGIPQKVMDKIFQPFFTTKPTGQGTGLGLSMSYDIIKAHEGELKVRTEEGKFAEFIIELPVIKTA